MKAHEIIRGRLEKLWSIFPNDPVTPSLFDDHATQIIIELGKHYHIISNNEMTTELKMFLTDVTPKIEHESGRVYGEPERTPQAEHEPYRVEIERKKIDPILDQLTEIRNLLTARISDLSDIKGMQGERHSFVFYRNAVADAIFTLKNLL